MTLGAIGPCLTAAPSTVKSSRTGRLAGVEVWGGSGLELRVRTSFADERVRVWKTEGGRSTPCQRSSLPELGHTNSVTLHDEFTRALLSPLYLKIISRRPKNNFESGLPH